MSQSILFFYIPCASAAEAEAIARAMVEEKLAACANILPAMKSVYRWEGRVEMSDETLLILKTTDTRADALEKRVRELHSHKTPCIAALPVERLNEDYRGWLLAGIT